MRETADDDEDILFHAGDVVMANKNHEIEKADCDVACADHLEMTSGVSSLP